MAAQAHLPFHKRRPSQRVRIPLPSGRKYGLEITRHRLPMHGLAPELDGAVVAHLSDFHAGSPGADLIIEEVVTRVMAEGVDLILLTGDFIDDSLKGREHPVERLLAPLSARLGVYAAYGNHDHRHGVERIERQLKSVGIRVLNNEVVELEHGLQVAAIDDLLEGSPDIEGTLAQLAPGRTGIVMSHNPTLFEHVNDHDIMVLSGHTHGAQFRLPFPTPEMICWVHLRCRQVAGWYHKGNVREYVSRGIGTTGIPLRFNCAGELALFEMVGEAPANAR